MASARKWRVNQSVHGFLVSLDISGFSKAEVPDGLLDHRKDLFDAVEATVLFPEASEEDEVRAQFLGDDLRLGFHQDVGAVRVRDFVSEVIAGLGRLRQHRLPEFQTQVKGVVLEGVITLRRWHKCEFFNGSLPYQAEDMMRQLHAGEVAVNEPFRSTLQSEGASVSGLQPTSLGGQAAYILPQEA